MNKWIKYEIRVNGRPVAWSVKRENAIAKARVRKADLFRPNDRIEVFHLTTNQRVDF